MIAPVQEDTSWEDQKTAEQQQQHLETLLAPVHKVSVEHVRVFGGWKSVLNVHKGDREREDEDIGGRM